MNELEGWVQVRETVNAIKELIIKAGDSVTASKKVDSSPKPILFQPVEGSRDKD
jgi:hypothetical protein